MHQELAIMRSYATPDEVSEQNTNEPALEVIDLLSVLGFSLAQDGWTPAVAQVRGGGVYAETASQDGAYLLASSVGRVTETMRLTASAATYTGRYTLEKRLRLMGRRARQFHYEPKLDPVYLKWHAEGAPGPQYALIYNIQIAPATPFGGINANELTITIDRAPEWTPIPPFMHPGVWGEQVDGVGLPANGTGMVSQIVYSANQLSNGPVIGEQAFIDIPAAEIPGDAPAMILVKFDARLAGSQAILTAFMGRRTRGLAYKTNFDGTSRNSIAINTWPVYLNVSAGQRVMLESTLGTDASLEADEGGYSFDTSVITLNGGNPRRLRVTFATATDQIRFTWRTDMTTFSGRWAAFLRGHQSSGAAGDLRVYLQYGYDGNDAVTEEVIPTLQTVATNTEYWPLLYLGEVTFPPDSARANMNRGSGSSIHGEVGVEVRDVSSGGSQENLVVNLRARRAAGTTAQLYVADLVLIPVDEQSAFVSFEQEPYPALVLGDGSVVIMDGTGYFTRQPDGSLYCMYFDNSGGAFLPSRLAEVRSAGFTLEPGVDNRIYFLFTSYETAPATLQRSSIISNPGGGVNEAACAAQVDITIIPRWYGVRDV